MPRECHPGHTQGLGPDEIYCIQERTVAEKRQALNDYRDVEFSRKCMVLFAAKENLNLDNDFITKSALIDRKQEIEVRLNAFEEIVEWVKTQEIIPEIDGKPPRIGGKHLCRMCATPLSADQLYVLDRRFLRHSLHPQLTREATDQAGRLDGLAFCDHCFKIVQATINQIAEKHDLTHIIRWEQGRTHLLLQDLIAAKSKRPSR